MMFAVWKATTISWPATHDAENGNSGEDESELSD